MNTIAENIRAVEEKTAEAAVKAGRDPSEILLCAVTKTHPAEMINQAIRAGVTDIGENKVQEILDKYEKVEKVRWHMIGHLQSNKVKYIIDKVCMIHSVESLKLAREIDRRAAQHDLGMDILIEVNTAGDEAKFGVAPEDAEDLIRQILGECPHLRIRGLMTIAPYADDPEEVRPYFRKTRQLFERLSMIEHPRLDFQYLSMGMSNDYGVAVEEGSTIIRVGSALFGARDYDRQ
ncbi:MAG: YggS family pyridoxal phosphate-dependent enzyme [Firmicutes bacterium]|nr:YggS family pyridoxal phosphate-dependent enzyme [Bacillota bacterium]